MKNIVFYIIIAILLFFLFIKIDFNSDKNFDRQEVSFVSCIDGDTANINYEGSVQKLRFLAINTKEIGENEEEYGYEASNYTCEKLKSAKKIEIEFDNLSDIYDKYDRLLAWVFIDNSLLQLELVEKGYAEVKYIYNDYKYLSELEVAENQAKEKKLGLWQIYY